MTYLCACSRSGFAGRACICCHQLTICMCVCVQPGVASVYCSIVQQTKNSVEFFFKHFQKLEGKTYGEARYAIIGVWRCFDLSASVQKVMACNTHAALLRCGFTSTAFVSFVPLVLCQDVTQLLALSHVQLGSELSQCSLVNRVTHVL